MCQLLCRMWGRACCLPHSELDGRHHSSSRLGYGLPLLPLVGRHRNRGTIVLVGGTLPWGTAPFGVGSRDGGTEETHAFLPQTPAMCGGRFVLDDVAI
jgi:hypothetical protein